MPGHKDHWYWEGAGDARRCPTHPYVKTSSPCGMFDAPCGECEYEMLEEEWEIMSPEARQAITDERNRRRIEEENKYRVVPFEDDIPF